MTDKKSNQEKLSDYGKKIRQGHKPNRKEAKEIARLIREEEKKSNNVNK